MLIYSYPTCTRVKPEKLCGLNVDIDTIWPYRVATTPRLVTVRPDADIGDVLSKMAGQYRRIHARHVSNICVNPRFLCSENSTFGNADVALIRGSIRRRSATCTTCL